MHPPVDFSHPRTTTPPPNLHEFICGQSTARIVLQPVVDLHDESTYGYEALARFGDRLTLSPTAWFVGARRGGESNSLQAHVLRAALSLRDRMRDDQILAVNVSPDALTSPQVQQVLSDQGPLDRVVIELTEHVHVEDLVALRGACDRLRTHGALIALDDVGAGWSGLAQIAALEPDILKIDRSLIARVDQSTAKQATVEALLVLANRLNAVVIAEGLERPEEITTVQTLGATLGQGFRLGRPTLPPPRTAPERADAAIV